MSDPRTLSVIAAALATGATALSNLIAESDAAVVPVNVHTVTGLLSTFATDAAAFADAVASAPAGTDAALTDRVTHIEALMTEAGLSPAAAPAPAPAEAPAPAPAA